MESRIQSFFSVQLALFAWMPAESNLKEINKQFPSEGKASSEIQNQKARALRNYTMSKYYEAAVELSRQLTKWSNEIESRKKRFFICSGGGPGNNGSSEQGCETSWWRIGKSQYQYPGGTASKSLSNR